MSALCQSCGAGMEWVRLKSAAAPSGAPHPVNVEKPLAPAAGLIVENPKSGKAVVLRPEDVPAAVGWIEKGAKLHESHYATCPGAERHRVNPEQMELL